MATRNVVQLNKRTAEFSQQAMMSAALASSAAPSPRSASRSGKRRLGSAAGMLVAVVLSFSATSAFAQSGTWTTDTSDVWSALVNWNGGVGPIANGSGNTADFSTV